MPPVELSGTPDGAPKRILGSQRGLYKVSFYASTPEAALPPRWIPKSEVPAALIDIWRQLRSARAALRQRQEERVASRESAANLHGSDENVSAAQDGGSAAFLPMATAPTFSVPQSQTQTTLGAATSVTSAPPSDPKADLNLSSWPENAVLATDTDAAGPSHTTTRSGRRAVPVDGAGDDASQKVAELRDEIRFLKTVYEEASTSATQAVAELDEARQKSEQLRRQLDEGLQFQRDWRMSELKMWQSEAEQAQAQLALLRQQRELSQSVDILRKAAEWDQHQLQEWPSSVPSDPLMNASALDGVPEAASAVTSENVPPAPAPAPRAGRPRRGAAQAAEQYIREKMAKDVQAQNEAAQDPTAAPATTPVLQPVSGAAGTLEPLADATPAQLPAAELPSASSLENTVVSTPTLPVEHSQAALPREFETHTYATSQPVDSTLTAMEEAQPLEFSDALSAPPSPVQGPMSGPSDTAGGPTSLDVQDAPSGPSAPREAAAYATSFNVRQESAPLSAEALDVGDQYEPRQSTTEESRATWKRRLDPDASLPDTWDELPPLHSNSSSPPRWKRRRIDPRLNADTEVLPSGTVRSSPP